MRFSYDNYHLTALTDDAYLSPYKETMRLRREHVSDAERRITNDGMDLMKFASAHEYFGLHFQGGKWIFREWAPNADRIVLVGDFTNWKEKTEFAMQRIGGNGTWEIQMPGDMLHHGDLYKLRVYWGAGSGDRIPAYARRVVQDNTTKIFSAQVWAPDKQYKWKHPEPESAHEPPLIYESHVGMAQENAGVGSYTEFKDNILPRILKMGYNTIQLMAIMEHPYYGSFGYHVSSFFAASSRFGTPEELKSLIDAAHGAGLSVIMDLVHSHAVNNEVEGLSRFDGTLYQYFHDGFRGRHEAWDSRCFNYSKPEVLHFLLSNCRFWLDEYHVDGFRFDGVTSMLYLHHGLGPAFDHYDRYFDKSVDEDAYTYLALANKLIHQIKPLAITIAEDVSGMPGLAAAVEGGGCGFDYRLAMGVPDCWFKLINDTRDEDWSMEYLWRELTNRRGDELVISYAESHDQALVGGKTTIFEMIDKEMYWSMRATDRNLMVDRGIALHKMIRLLTVSTAGGGYLNFIGNEFGHPEWVDFPREGNNWSYHYARRQWHLRDDQDLKYHFLADFDIAMLDLVKKNGVMEKGLPRKLWSNEGDKIMFFERAGMLFLFNFHPSKSFTDYPVGEVPPGEYVLILDTDEERFGGYKRLESNQHYFSEPVVQDSVQRHYIKVYIPCRCAMVLKRVPPASGAKLSSRKK
jgi:1,4-alpha-glucan branching enzyme